MDARFDVDGNRLKLRVAGIIIHNNKLLLEEYNKKNIYFFPGGTINLNETSEDAIKRELKEEIDKEFVIDKLVSVCEEFYINYKNDKTHCIGFYYKMKFKNIDDVNSIDMNRLEDDHGYMCQHHYKWVDLKDLETINIVPKKIKEEIIKNEFNIHHVIKDV